VIFGIWILWKQPTYAPPPDDEIDILLELAGVFPDNYGIQWRVHGALRASDPDAQSDPSLLRGAQFMHNLTTGETRSDGDIYLEVAYRYYATDHEIQNDPTGATCRCDTSGRTSTVCQTRLPFDNYEFTLLVSYNSEACTTPTSPKRTREFLSSRHTAERLIGLYLEPLRRKPRWL
jgi:hypothetical protein